MLTAISKKTFWNIRLAVTIIHPDLTAKQNRTTKPKDNKKPDSDLRRNNIMGNPISTMAIKTLLVWVKVCKM